jgi:hypothetical protein
MRFKGGSQVKLGIFMLIFGLILAGAGVAAFTYADPNVSLFIGGRLGVEQARIADAAGIGVTVLGGGLAIGGIVRMIVKR